jgi:hypothetical protein
VDPGIPKVIQEILNSALQKFQAEKVIQGVQVPEVSEESEGEVSESEDD